MQNGWLNEMFAEEDAANADRQDRILQLMDKDDKVWRTERCKQLLGRYANVESWEEVETLLDEDPTKEAQEIEKKVELAKRAGVTLTMLEPNELASSSSFGGGGGGGDAPSGDGSDKGVNRPLFNPRSTGVAGRASWFGIDNNIDLEAEFQSLPAPEEGGICR